MNDFNIKKLNEVVAKLHEIQSTYNQDIVFNAFIMVICSMSQDLGKDRLLFLISHSFDVISKKLSSD